MALALDLAWAAGFIDGEGCIHIARRPSGAHALILTVTQKDPLPLRELARIFQEKQPRLSRKSDGRDMWVWATSSRKAAHVLEQILPYLRFKRAQAELGLAFQRRRSRVAYQDCITGRFARADLLKDDADYAEMRALKRVAA